ncbi:MAG: histidine--tRNA ligase [Candidatus Omnitrophota bacterium]
MEDILPGEIEKWQWIEEKARIFFEAHGFKEIRTPILEPTELFVRSIGQASDIVHKEMFSFKDRGERDMTMRPEMTASVARSVIEKGLLKTSKSLRLYYMGPMFRAERPQAGRKRQFHQIGAEMINEPGVNADIECIKLLYDFLHYVGLKNFKLNVNDLRDICQSLTIQKLRAYFSQEKNKLCKDCQWRLEKNVLRIFDCKIKSCQPVIESAPWNNLNSDILEGLKKYNISYHINRRLVRGLDYYTGPVFEVTAEGIGAQDAIAGGGSYDNLYIELSGKVTPCTPTPCTGFSIGIERLLIAIEAQDSKAFDAFKRNKIYFAPLEENSEILQLCREKAVSLREAGFGIELCPGVFSLSQHLKKANQIGLRFMVIVGPDELKKKKMMVKDLEKREQEEVDIEEVVAHFKKVMNLC